LHAAVICQPEIVRFLTIEFDILEGVSVHPISISDPYAEAPLHTAVRFTPEIVTFSILDVEFAVPGDADVDSVRIPDRDGSVPVLLHTAVIFPPVIAKLPSHEFLLQRSRFRSPPTPSAF
jgi:hypothetical protein